MILETFQLKDKTLVTGSSQKLVMNSFTWLEMTFDPGNLISFCSRALRN